MNDLLGLQRLALLGREAEIKTIENIARRCRKEAKAHIIFIEGQGGIGKTHLLNHVKTLAEGRAWTASEDVLDLDNPEYATPWGLAQGLVAATVGGWEKAPEAIQEAWKKAYQALRRGKVEEIQTAWATFEQSLHNYLKSKTHTGLFILRLDTAEWLRAVMEDDKTCDRSDEDTHAYPWEFNAGRWLTERVIHQTKGLPILWLIAGRPADQKPDALHAVFEQVVGKKQFLRIKLGPLPPEARSQYLDELADAIQQDAPHGAQNLRDYIQKHRTAFAQATQGYPLYMAIAADLLRLNKHLPSAFYEPKTSEPPKKLAAEMHKALMQSLITERSALGYILERMARARLGASEGMLQAWWEAAQRKKLSAPAGWGFKEIKNRLENLVTVKHFPKRHFAYFLHDEIYDFINKTWPLKERPLREDVLETVLQDLRAYRQDKEKAKSLSTAEKHQIEAQEIYYRIWHHPWKGYPHYLAKANDWAKTSPLAFRRLIRYMDRLHHWMLKTEQREKTQTFWDFWKVEHCFHEAALWITRYDNLAKAKKVLPENLPENAPSPQSLPILHTLQALTRALLAYYEKNFQEEQEQLQNAKEDLHTLKQAWGEGQTSQLLQAVLDNHYGMWHRRQGRMRDARAHYRRALQALRNYQLEGTAGVLINFTYVEVLLAHPRTAENLLKEAKHYLNPDDKKTSVRLYNVSTLHYALIENPNAATTSAKQVLQICAEEDYPRFRALTLMHWARALRGGWNDAVGWGANMDETLPHTIIAGLRRVLSQTEVAKVIIGLRQEKPFLKMWEKPFGELPAPICTATAWELKDHLQPDETAELYREIGRLWREWAWARQRQHDEQAAKQLSDATEAYLWRAATKQTTPPNKWWETVEKRAKVARLLQERSKTATPLTPLAALIDLFWHYHYQHKLPHETETNLCRWLLTLFPQTYSATWENWPPPAQNEPPQSGPDDPRLWGEIGKVYMLWGHSCLRALRSSQTPEGKTNCLREAVDKIALSMEFNNLLGSNSPAMQRAEANLHDWLLRHGHEAVDSTTTVLQGFIEEAQNFCKQYHPQCQRLQKFIEERFI